MTIKEFEAWKAETNRSALAWVKDPIHSQQPETLFMYRGGESGTYVEVKGAVVTVGSYTDAFPHIGEGLFKPKGSHTCKNFEDALSRIFTALGLDATIEALV